MNAIRSALSVIALGALAACSSDAPLPVQQNVDLQKYAGTWYEQARLPNRFQKDCTGEVRADYRLNADGTIAVTNQCRVAGGGTDMAEGLGRQSKAVEPPSTSILEVRFAPAWLSWLPLAWGDYWIMRVEGDYRYALVGTPDREYLWVLSRDKQADAETVRKLLSYAADQGFDITGVEATQQTAEGSRPPSARAVMVAELD